MKNEEPNESNNRSTIQSSLNNGISCRRTLNIMVFLGFMVNYMLRVNLTFAIVYMVLNTNNTSNSSVTVIGNYTIDPFRNDIAVPTTSAPTSTSSNRTRREASPFDFKLPKLPQNFGINGNNGAEVSRTQTTKFTSQNNNNSSSGKGELSQRSPKSDIGYDFEVGAKPKDTVPRSSNGNVNLGYDFELPELSRTTGPSQTVASTTAASGEPLKRTRSEIEAAAVKSDVSEQLAERQAENDSNSQNPNVVRDGLTTVRTGDKSSELLLLDEPKKPNISSLSDNLLTNGSSTPFSSNDDTASSGSPSATEISLSSSNNNVVDRYNSTAAGSSTTESGTEVALKKINPLPDEPSALLINSEYRKDKNKFTWSEQKQGLLLGSFFWGYVCTELPGGRLAELIGARSVFGYATLGASVVTLLTPLSAKINFLAIVLLRIALGLLLGPTWPSVLPLAAKWIPPNERGKFMSNMMASTLGAAFTLPVCSFIIETSSWEYVFYVTGLVGFVWSVCWFMLVYDSPAQHPRISVKELRYIESQLKIKSSVLLSNDKCESPYSSDQEENQFAPSPANNTQTDRNKVPRTETIEAETERRDASDVEKPAAESKNNSENGSKEDSVNKQNGHITDSTSEINNSFSGRSKENNLSFNRTAETKSPLSASTHAQVPWLKIIASLPVWAFVVTHTASVFGYNTITVQLPTYMKHILHYDIKSNGILSSLPYLGKYIMAIIAGSIADSVLRSNKLSKTATRKLFTALAVMVPGFFMLLQVYFGEDKVISIIIFTAALTVNGLVTGGYLGNTLDLAPNYSGTIFGMGNMFSSGGGALSTLIVGYLTNNQQQAYGQWQKVFWIVSFMYIGGAAFFLAFGTAEIQPWDPASRDDKSKREKNESKPLNVLKSKSMEAQYLITILRRCTQLYRNNLPWRYIFKYALRPRLSLTD